MQIADPDPNLKPCQQHVK